MCTFLDGFFGRIFWTDFFEGFFGRIFWTDFFNGFFEEFFRRTFLKNFNFSEDFLTYNLFTVASFRIGVPSILFLSILHIKIFFPKLTDLQCFQSYMYYLDK